MTEPLFSTTEVSAEITGVKDAQADTSARLETFIEAVERRAAERRLELPPAHRSIVRRGAEWVAFGGASLLVICLLLAMFEIGEHIGLVSIAP